MHISTEAFIILCVFCLFMDNVYMWFKIQSA